MICNANRWRKQRNETPLEQTAVSIIDWRGNNEALLTSSFFLFKWQEMAAAEEYTKSRQLRAKETEEESSFTK